MTVGPQPAAQPLLDLRMPALGAAAWLGAVAGTLARGLVLTIVLAAAGLLVLVALSRSRRCPDLARVTVALVLLAVAAAGAAALRIERVADNPVAGLAGERAAVSVVGTVSSDPRRIAGSFSQDRVVWRLTVREVTGRGRTLELSAPVLVLADAEVASASTPVLLGAQVRIRGRLIPAESRDLAALLHASGPPEPVAAPGPWWRAAGSVRQALRDSVAHRPDDQRALVPALVVGDDAEVGAALEESFQATGLTHLLAVSGTNLTLLVGFLLVIARWCRVRGRWLHLVAGLGIVGFVLVARTEPSVLRAAVMGTIGLVALGADGPQRALRALGTAVVVLVFVDPSLAVSAGFALSVLATAGILLLAPGWREALARWLPRWLAEAIAVPAAAQLACTPMVAAISGQVSLVAVAANLLVAPVVGPATVLGLAAGLMTLAWEPLGRLCGTLASWCVAWLVAVAERGADLPTAAVGWGTGPAALVLLTVLSVAVALVGPRLLRHPVCGLAVAVLMVSAVLVRPPTFGWPPDGWLLVVCDVGQGDALVVHAGPGEAVVVDAGPDPRAADRCLDRLAVRRVPLVVLTHFHADHVDGLSGVLEGRDVGVVQTTGLLDPPEGVRRVGDAVRSAEVGVQPSTQGAAYAVGAVSLQVLWPPPDVPTRGPGDGSTANDASVVLLVEAGGLRFLLTGDVEPAAQAALARSWPGLEVDVLKLPHHGSAHQDESWLLSLQPAVVLVSVGADNDYGHPARSATAPLTDSGAKLFRTDTHGDLAVVVDGDRPRVLTRR